MALRSMGKIGICKARSDVWHRSTFSAFISGLLMLLLICISQCEGLMGVERLLQWRTPLLESTCQGWGKFQTWNGRKAPLRERATNSPWIRNCIKSYSSLILNLFCVNVRSFTLSEQQQQIEFPENDIKLLQLSQWAQTALKIQLKTWKWCFEAQNELYLS